MRSWVLLAALLASATASATARAQELPTAETAMAAVISNALAPASYGDWRYSWTAVSSRVSYLMHWHLYGPETGDETTIKRNGWISASGQQIGVSAYGEGDTVSSLTFEINRWRFSDSDHDALVAALAANDVAMVETARRAPPEFYHTDTPVIVYSLTAPGRDPGVLTRTESCTSPGSAAARRCEVSYELALGG
jgi:hypothetical protein